MNFKQISKKYPKAWDRFKEKETFNWDFSDYSIEDMCAWIGANYHLRDLYDFFDSEGIVIEIAFDYDNNTFYSSIEKANGVSLFTSVDCTTRSEAEEAGFIKAFEILENKL